MAEGDIRVTVTSYTTSIGYRIHAADGVRRCAPDHRIHLYGPGQPGGALHVQIEFSDVLPDVAEAIGAYYPRERRAELRVPVNEYDRAIALLRAGRPVSVVFNHSGAADRQPITSATLTTGTEDQ